MTVVVNGRRDPARVEEARIEAEAFHRALPGYAPTPVHDLPGLAEEAGVGAVLLKDESDRLGLPAFKVLGASWAIERTLGQRPEVRTLVAASAGNHGRAVAHVAGRRGLGCRVFLPARSSPARRQAIEAEGAEVVVVDGSYEDAVAAAAAAAGPGVAVIADVGSSPQARWVIDGYATLFREAAGLGAELVLVPVGVGSLAAAAVRFAAPRGIHVVGVEPLAAACLGASLAAGSPTAVATPGTAMAGLDCAEISAAAWPSLLAGITGVVTVSDAEVQDDMRMLAALGLAIGDCGASPVSALRRLAAEPAGAPLREAVGLGPASRVLLIATEGPTDPEAYERALRRA